VTPQSDSNWGLYWCNTQRLTRYPVLYCRRNEKRLVQVRAPISTVGTAQPLVNFLHPFGLELLRNPAGMALYLVNRQATPRIYEYGAQADDMTA
jgi:hypothetical protein